MKEEFEKVSRLLKPKDPETCFKAIRDNISFELPTSH
jgi:hypothetical protein